MNNEVVITGLGFLTPLGDSIETINSNLIEGKTAIKKLTRHDYSTMSSSFGGEITDKMLNNYVFDKFKLKSFKDYIKYGLASSYNALMDSNLLGENRKLSHYDEYDFGAYVSTGINGENAEGLFEGFARSADENNQFDKSIFGKKGMDRVHPKWILTSLSNNLIYFITSEYNIKGDNNNVTYSGLGGCTMLESAYYAVKNGICNGAIITGTDSIINWQTMDDLSKSKVLQENQNSNKDKILPYTNKANGTLPSEGSCSIIIENLETAKKRNAKVYGKIKGISQVFSAMSRKENDGFKRVINELNEFKNKDSKNTQINLCGSSIKEYDELELKQINDSINSVTTKDETKFICTKPHFGNIFSASFVLDTAVSATMLKNQTHFNLPFVSEINDSKERFENKEEFKHDNAISLGQGIYGDLGGILIEKL